MNEVETIKREITKLALTLASKEGWNNQILEKASAEAGVDSGMGALLFNGDIRNVIEYFINNVYKTAYSEYFTSAGRSSRIQDIIFEFFTICLRTLAPNKPAISKMLSFFMLPWNTAFGIKTLWRCADNVWYELLNDGSLDFNFYTKRCLLSYAVLNAILFWQNDESVEYIDTIGFLRAELSSIVKTGSFIKKLCK